MHPTHDVDSTHNGMSIEFIKVSFTYPSATKKALDDVSFRIEAGEVGGNPEVTPVEESC